MNADQVNRVFAWAERRFNGSPCRECQGRSTVAHIVQLAVIVSCEDCGGATLKGRLAPRSA